MNNTDLRPHRCEQDTARIIQGYPDSLQLDHSHPVIRRLAEEDRDEFLELVKIFAECLPMYNFEWSDRVSASERATWSTPGERFLNFQAWDIISSHYTPSLHQDVVDVLRELEIRETEFDFLDSDDRERINSTLANAVAMAYFHSKKLDSGIKTALTTWLQEWTESDEPDLDALIRQARQMATSEGRPEKVNWQGEGF